jgi:hypothetical protein
MSSVLVPGLSGLLGNSSKEEWKRCIVTWSESFSSSLMRGASARKSHGARLRDDLFASAKDDSQNVRDNNAAWVAGPSRICFYNGPPPTA